MFVFFTLNSFLTIKRINVDSNWSIADFRNVINYYGPLKTEKFWVLFDNYSFNDYEIYEETYFFGYSLSNFAKFITKVGRSMDKNLSPMINNHQAQLSALSLWNNIQTKFRGECEICEEPSFINTRCGCLICIGCAGPRCPICNTKLAEDEDSLEIEFEAMRV